MASPSMGQIAKELGVSKGLVSLALSGKYGVSEEMRSKIVLYAIQNGYDFSRCRGQKKSRGDTVGVVLSQNDLLAERFWPRILKGVEGELYNHALKMKAIVWDKPEDCKQIVLDLAVSGYSGLIILNEFPQAELDSLAKISFPIVIVDGKKVYECQFDTVRADNYAGGYIGAQYLAKQGHRRLLFLGYAGFSRSFKQRYHGFMDGLEAIPGSGIAICSAISPGKEPGPLERDALDFIYNRSELLEFFSGAQPAPTAIMCANDPIAMEAVQALAQAGLSVPGDVSVLGFDNIKDSEYCSPKLTTLHVPKEELGKSAVKMLINRLDHPDEPLQSVALDVSLVIRDSVRPWED